MPTRSPTPPPTCSPAHRLRSHDWPRFLEGPDPDLRDRLYVPGLKCAVRYDRCCAYFSSRVLSAAAAGFGGLIENLLALGDAAPRPAVRLLVNEELSKQDADALLERSDPTGLIQHLLRRFKTPKTAFERTRLRMLAWLVNERLLAVKVGVMRHSEGIAHAKFGILGDGDGDEVVFAGSDNESAQALLANYEELELSTSWGDPDRLAYFRDKFERLWQGTHPYVRTVELPQAVKERLLKFVPPEPPLVEPVDEERGALRTALLWQFLAAAPYLENGEAACDATALVDVWPHQRLVVDDTAAAWPAGRLLCDEVGMGKTIEAILVLRRLLMGRGVKRALLLLPAGLLEQWQGELREKGALLVPYFDDRALHYPDDTLSPCTPQAAFAEDLVMVSREWARTESNRPHVLSAPKWDLVLLDEAHAARRREAKEGQFNAGNLLLSLLRDLQLRGRTRSILLLSATPMQTQPWEPWDLLTVLGVGGPWAVEFGDLREYHAAMASLQSGRATHAAVRPAARLLAGETDFPAHPSGKIQLPADRGRLATALAGGLARQQAESATWLRKGSPLSRTMHRFTRDTLRCYYERGVLAAEPPRRQVRDVTFDYEWQAERDVYESVSRYIDERFALAPGDHTGKGFVRTIYRRRAASSPRALENSLEHRLERLERYLQRKRVVWWLPDEEAETDVRDLADEDLEEEQIPASEPPTPEAARAEQEQIQNLLAELRALGTTDTKRDRFCKVLDEVRSDGRPALVFTCYTDTMGYLREELRPRFQETLACFSGRGGEVWQGEWVTVPKAEITSRLDNGELQVLLCTDAASEGLNLQAAGALLNYDLPWNPSKVEQRIGRIDRIGQRHADLPVANLFLADSVDQRVYEVLRMRCRLFEQFVGPMQPVLALARKALRNDPPPAELQRLLAEMEAMAKTAAVTPEIGAAFAASEAADAPTGDAPVTREDLRQALDALTAAETAPSATRLRGLDGWRLSRVGRSNLRVSLDAQSLERDEKLIPLSLTDETVRRIADKLPLPRGKSPLVIEYAQVGAFRCAEVRWAAPDRDVRIRSVKHLQELCNGWDGAPPPQDRLLKAEEKCRREALRRVTRAQRDAAVRERRALEAQVAAARLRLLRELGRTLRCHGSGDLNQTWHRLMQAEGPGGRYRRCYERLGNWHDWQEDELADLREYVDALTRNDIEGRLLGSQLDAALADPRGQAVETLKENTTIPAGA